MEGWFIEIGDLQFEGMGKAQPPAAARGCLEPWLPKGIGVLATLHNYDADKECFDYIIVTEKLVYFAILCGEGSSCALRSVKTFKQDFFYAMGHMVAPCPGQAGDDFPHVRILLRDGQRIKLSFREDHKDLLPRLQQLAQSTFFRS